jgi:hypothetical protein
LEIAFVCQFDRGVARETDPLQRAGDGFSSTSAKISGDFRAAQTAIFRHVA